jgi:hypothetical protein
MRPELRPRTALFVALASAVWATGCGRVEPSTPSDEWIDEIESAVGCGVERWSVKTGTDPDASRVSSTITPTTIAALIAAHAPANPPANARVAPQELQTFQLRDATLTMFKLESDSDYHLILSDGSRTMIAEIPSPACVGSTSPFLSMIRSARAAFDARFTATTSFQTANATATLTGVGFFDFIHGQAGVAPNGIELHPVLGICFGAGCSSGAANDFRVSVSPSSQAVRRGSSVSYAISTAVTSGSAQSISLSVAGLPRGVTGAFTPPSVTAGGSSTLRVSATTSAATGASSFTITARGTSATHAASATLSVQ